MNGDGSQVAASRNAAQLSLWNAFCDAHRVAETGVPLLATAADGAVEVLPYGRDGRWILRRSALMEELLIATADRVLAAPSSPAVGVLYLMHALDSGGRVAPLYVGKAGRFGRSGAVSVNLVDIRANSGKFARRGCNYACHMGDLSAAVLAGHAADKSVMKCRRWAARLFHSDAAGELRPRTPARFWCTAWGPGSPNIWADFGSCPLAFAEYLLIGVSGLLFPEVLLNSEGVHRAAAASDND